MKDNGIQCISRWLGLVKKGCIYVGKAEYMGIDTEPHDIFGDGRMSKLSSDCFCFSVGSSGRCQKVEGLYIKFEEKREDLKSSSWRMRA